MKNKIAILGTYFTSWNAAKEYTIKVRKEQPDKKWIILSYKNGFMVVSERQKKEILICDNCKEDL